MLAELGVEPRLQAGAASFQGAAIGGGGLWIARSDWNWGTLDRLDPVTGAPQRCYVIELLTNGP